MDDEIVLITENEVNAFAFGRSTIFYRRIPSSEVSGLSAKYRNRDGTLNSKVFNEQMLRRGIVGWNTIVLKPRRGDQPEELYPDWAPEKGTPDAKLLGDLIGMLPGQVLHDANNRPGLLTHMTDAGPSEEGLVKN